MSIVFKEFFITNPLVFWIFVSVISLIIILTTIFVIKEIKKK